MTERSAVARPATAPLRAVRVAAAATVAVLAWQFVTAGALLGPDGHEGLHAAGAIALHVVTLATAVAALWLQQRTGGPVWPAALAAVVFVAGFGQAALGSAGAMWAHVPGALVLTVGSVWLLAWSVRPHAAG